MAQPIVRIYDNRQTAQSVADALKAAGYRDVHIVGPAALPPPHTPDHDETQHDGAPHADDAHSGTPHMAAPSDAVAQSLLRMEIPPEHATIYEDRINRGAALVAVRAPFGHAHGATKIMDDFHPATVELPHVEHAAASATTDHAAPLSSWLGWRTLLHDPAPLSRMLNMPTLKSQPTNSSTRDGIHRQSGDPAPLSGKLGMPVLSGNAAPLSGKVGMATLSDNAAPLSSKFGWRVLSHNPTPLSSWLGWRVLLK